MPEGLEALSIGLSGVERGPSRGEAYRCVGGVDSIAEFGDLVSNFSCF